MVVQTKRIRLIIALARKNVDFRQAVGDRFHLGYR